MKGISESIPEILDKLIGNLNTRSTDKDDIAESISAFEEACNWVADKIDRARRCEKDENYAVHEIGHGILFASRYLIEVINDMEDE